MVSGGLDFLRSIRPKAGKCRRTLQKTRKHRQPREVAATDDLETARKAVEDTAAIGGGLWLSYLFVLFYLGIAAGAVTHADLLLQAPVKLPFLNIELPLLAFFFLAPLLLLLTHAYTLVHLVLLARRVAQFNAIEGLSEAWAAPASEQHLRAIPRRPGGGPLRSPSVCCSPRSCG